jgi:hypothetical protein
MAVVREELASELKRVEQSIAARQAETALE